MERSLTIAGALLGMLAVLAGTFGAHFLTLDAREMEWFATGARYHMYHALATVLAAWAVTRFHARLAVLAGWLFFSGALIFAGSLYLLALSGQLMGKTLLWLGAITPIGGVCLLVGWTCLIAAAMKNK